MNKRHHKSYSHVHGEQTKTDNRGRDRNRSTARSDETGRSRSRSPLMYGPVLPPDMIRKNYTPTEESHRKIDELTRVVEALAREKELDEDVNEALSKLVKSSSAVPYKDRASEAIRESGLKPGKFYNKYRLEPSRSYPEPPPPKTTVKYPLVPMVRSRLRASYRNMLGLKDNEDTWDSFSSTPPSKPPKFFEQVKKPKSTEIAYGVDSTYFPDKGLNLESCLNIKPSALASVKYSRLADWDKTLAQVLGMVNMLDIFMSSGNKAQNDLYNSLEEFDDLPPELSNLLEKRERMKEDQISRAKALQDITDSITWLWTDLNLARRDNVLNDSKLKLVGRTKELLRSQRLCGPMMFNDRLDEILKEEVERTSTAVVVSAVSKLGQSLSYQKSNYNKTKEKESGKGNTSQKRKTGQYFQRRNSSEDNQEDKSGGNKSKKGFFNRKKNRGGRSGGSARKNRYTSGRGGRGGGEKD